MSPENELGLRIMVCVAIFAAPFAMGYWFGARHEQEQFKKAGHYFEIDVKDVNGSVLNRSGVYLAKPIDIPLKEEK